MRLMRSGKGFWDYWQGYETEFGWVWVIWDDWETWLGDGEDSLDCMKDLWRAMMDFLEVGLG